MSTLIKNSQNEKQQNFAGEGSSEFFAVKNTKTFYRRRLKFLLLATFLILSATYSSAQLMVEADPNCTTQCCSPMQPCNCTAGIKVTGAMGQLIINVFGPGITGLLVGTYTLCYRILPGHIYFEVRDSGPNVVVFPVTVGGNCCKLICRDTSICYAIPDSMVILNPPSFADTSGGGTSGGGGCSLCFRFHVE